MPFLEHFGKALRNIRELDAAAGVNARDVMMMHDCGRHGRFQE
jgi:hypothetical protein